MSKQKLSFDVAASRLSTAKLKVNSYENDSAPPTFAFLGYLINISCDMLCDSFGHDIMHFVSPTIIDIEFTMS